MRRPAGLALLESRHVALLALILVTAVWGVTFVQVKDAVTVYPLFAFLTLAGRNHAGRTRRRRLAPAPGNHSQTLIYSGLDFLSQQV